MRRRLALYLLRRGHRIAALLLVPRRERPWLAARDPGDSGETPAWLRLIAWWGIDEKIG
jgi:hypothetical protein